MPRPSAPILAFCNPKGMPAMPSTPDSTTGLGSRLRQLRAQRAMTQQDLAGQVGIHYTHIGRYEANKSLPAADTLKRIAQALGTTTDYLMDGNTQDAAKSRLTDKALLQRFEDVANLPDEKKAVVMEVLDAFLALHQLKSLTNRQAG
jgi:transcriptional regulator with XRE-family HTH domain